MVWVIQKEVEEVGIIEEEVEEVEGDGGGG